MVKRRISKKDELVLLKKLHTKQELQRMAKTATRLHMDGQGWSDIIKVVKNISNNPMVKHVSNEAWQHFIKPWIQKTVKNTTGYNLHLTKGSGRKKRGGSLVPIGKGKKKPKKKAVRRKGGSLVPVGRGCSCHSRKIK